MSVEKGASPNAVDAGAHIWPAGLPHPAQRSNAPLDATPARLIRDLDAAGVGTVLLAPASIHPHPQFVMDAAAAFPGHMRTIGVLRADDPDGATAVALARARGDLGLRVNLGAGDGTAMLSESLRAAVAAADRFHMTIVWTARGRALQTVIRAATEATNARHVVDHLGLPADPGDRSTSEAVRVLAALPNTFVKVSGLYAISRTGFPYVDLWGWIEAVVAAFGERRSMWASDWPLCTESASYSDQAAVVRELPFLDDAARDWIMRRTATVAWNLAPDSGSS